MIKKPPLLHDRRLFSQEYRNCMVDSSLCGRGWDGMGSPEPAPWQEAHRTEESNAAGVARGKGHRAARGFTRGLLGPCADL